MKLASCRLCGRECKSESLPPFLKTLLKHIFIIDRKNPKIANLEHLPKPIKDGLGLIRNLIVEKFQPETILLFGSLATKDWTWKSDFDLLFVADTSERPHLELEAISESGIKAKVERTISPAVVSPELLNDKLEVKHYFFDDIVKTGHSFITRVDFLLPK